VPADFNIADFTKPRSQGHVSALYPTLMLMISTKIEWSFNKIVRLSDSADLAELLFPGNRNRQHAFLVVFLALKWSDHRMVPNLEALAHEHGISRRTMERVRAKMRRIGLIDRVGRFNTNYGGREGWVLSGRFERSLRELADRVSGFKATFDGSRDKDAIVLEFADTRRRMARPDDTDQCRR
jgi:hypothetical protein